MPRISDQKYLVTMGWDDVPHIDAGEQEDLLNSTPEYLRDARKYGKPSLGAGAIYPVPETEIICDPFQIPDYWPRAAGMDVGWNRTAVIWGARDRNSLTTYLYSEYYRGEAEPSVHVTGIKARGDWMPIAIDPAARGRSQDDGTQLFQDYVDLGLNLYKAINAVESGIYDVWQALSNGQLKVFSTLQNWRMEYRLYRRDEKGRVVKELDHLMDGTRYLVMSGLELATIAPKPYKPRSQVPHREGTRTGYS